MKILVGSENPVKIECAKNGFEEFFDSVEVMGISVSSGVSDQPLTEDETVDGARGRAEALREKDEHENLEADFFVGIEGGVRKIADSYYEFGCIYIIDRHGRHAMGQSSLCSLPESITKRLLTGEELGPVIDNITGDENIKQKGGAIGYFTKGKITRSSFYHHGVIMALVPFLNEELYFDDEGTN